MWGYVCIVFLLYSVMNKLLRYKCDSRSVLDQFIMSPLQGLRSSISSQMDIPCGTERFKN